MVASGQKLTGLFRGKVLKHLSGGKCKVFIPGVYDDAWSGNPDMLPDAEQMTPLFAGGVFGNGCYSYPNIGAVVVCQFLNGDQNYPLIMGLTLGSDFGRQKYAECAPELDPATGKEPAYIHIISVGKTKIKLYEGGQAEISVSGTKGKAGLTIDTEGNMFIDCDETLQVRAKNVKVMTNEQQSYVAGKSISLAASDQVYGQAGNVQFTANAGKVILSSPEIPSGKQF